VSDASCGSDAWRAIAAVTVSVFPRGGAAAVMALMTASHALVDRR